MPEPKMPEGRMNQPSGILEVYEKWWRGMDLNHGPSGYEPDELPDCSTPRCVYAFNLQVLV